MLVQINDGLPETNQITKKSTRILSCSVCVLLVYCTLPNMDTGEPNIFQLYFSKPGRRKKKINLHIIFNLIPDVFYTDNYSNPFCFSIYNGLHID